MCDKSHYYEQGCGLPGRVICVNRLHRELTWITQITRIREHYTIDKDIFDGFTVNLFFHEDGEYFARLVEFPNVSVSGPTPAEALSELKTAWELMKECYQMDDAPIPKPPSRNEYEGPFNLPIEEQLYRALTDKTKKARISLYALVMQKLSKTTAL